MVYFNINQEWIP